MRTVKVKIKGVSPIAFSKHYEVPRLEKESDEDYEDRTWRNRAHVDKEGQVVINPTMFKNMLYDVAKFLSETIKGKGKQTWTKHFESGILVVDPAPLGIKVTDISDEYLFVPSGGIRGSGRRVWKHFPVIHNWEAQFTVFILDDTITEPIFERYVHEAGKFIGLGFFRPGRGGTKGRFSVTKFEWIK
jgi:hypothetical protein